MNTRRIMAAILTVLVVATVYVPTPVAAQPQPTLDASDTDIYVFPGENFTISYTFGNSGDETGLRPILEIIVPINITFNSATYMGLPVKYSCLLYTSPSPRDRG